MSNQETILYNAHTSALNKGRYSVDVVQKVSESNNAKVEIFTEPASFSFEVGEDRVQIERSEIAGHYPPQNTEGDYLYTLPHLIFANSLLPWEERVKGAEEETPWLFLLLVNARDAGYIKQDTVMVNGTSRLTISMSGAYFRSLFFIGDSDTDKETTFFKRIAHLAHVRKTGEENVTACLFANRIPSEGTATVHVISLKDTPQGEFQFPHGDETVTLFSLYNFSFFTTAGQRDDLSHLHQLNASFIHTRFSAPLSSDTRFSDLKEAAFLPLKHIFRNGVETASFYRGPLVPVKIGEDISFTRRSDELYRKQQETGVWDVSYAAAWNLGRSLALGSTVVRNALMSWQREHLTALKRKKVDAVLNMTHITNLISTRRVEHSKLKSVAELAELDTNLEAWMQLQDLPLEYLVPDSRMIPRESIRFFYLDEAWMKSFLFGAFNVAILNDFEHTDYKDGARIFWEKARTYWGGETPFGFLMRSDVVSHFSAFTISGVNQEGEQALPWCTRQFGDCLLVLFKQEPVRVEIKKPHQLMHAGFVSGNAELKLQLKSDQPDQFVTVPVNQKNNAIDINSVIDALALKIPQSQIEPGSADFAYHALKTEDGVVFLTKKAD